MTGTSITKKGLKLITKILASGKELNFTRAAVGTGNVPAGYDKENMIDLAAYKMDGTISRCVSEPENQQASIVMQISSIGVIEGFTVTEAGIFAQDPDEGEILYAYTDMTEDPQYIYPEDSAISKFMELTLVVVVGTVEKVTAYISPGSLVSAEEFYGLKEELEAGKTTVEFEKAKTREEINSGENQKTLWGKVKKWLEDLGMAAFCSVVNHCMATEEGTVLDGRVGKVLMDDIEKLKEADKEINSNIGFDTRLNNGVPEWRERGADTWSPFRGKITKVILGYITANGTSGGTYNYNCTAYNGYENFTIDNFSIFLERYWAYYISGGSQINDGGSYTSLSYNAQTGILTVTCPKHIRDKGYSCSVYAAVCLFY